MKRNLFFSCLGFSFALVPLAGAGATVIAPRVGIAATEAVVGSQMGGVFTVTRSSGEPGTTAPNYSPKAFFGPQQSLVDAFASIQGSGFGITASGLASANLATGQLKVGAISTLQNLQGQDYTVGTSASAVFSDVLTVLGDISSPITARLSMTVSGGIQGFNVGAGIPNDSSSNIAAFFLGGTATDYAEMFIGNLQGTSADFSDLSRGGHVSVASYGADRIQLTLYNDYTLTSSNRQIAFMASASASPIAPDSYGTIVSDFEHTANLSITLPDGFSFTSLSGVFLSDSQTDTPESVPEPATFAFLLSGLSVLILAQALSKFHLVR